MAVAEQLMVVSPANSYEVNARNISEIKFPTAPRLGGDVVLKNQVDELKNRIKSHLENFQKNYICEDVEYLKQGLSETKELVLALYNLVKEFNEIYAEHGFDFDDFKDAAELLYKEKAVKARIYGENGENMQSFPESCDEYFENYSHVKLLFIRTEDKFELDSKGNRVVDENGEDILVTIEDDDEFDKIADIFDDEFSDILYDED
jgi:hypothetical protein